MCKTNRLNLDKVFFKLLVEGTFFISCRGVVACGRVTSGEISHIPLLYHLNYSRVRSRTITHE